jgi:WD40 repeat protein
MFARRASFAILLAVAGFASAQTFDRRGTDLPEIVVEAGGRYGTCDVLKFAPDGSFLVAGGDDKVARLWPYANDALKANEAEVLRWPSWREQRGGIKDLAVSPDGRKFALGGYGMKPSTVVVVAREQGRLLAITWPESRNGIDDFNVVHSVAFHPDGERVAFGTADGSLWIWKPEKLAKETKGRAFNSPLRAGKHEALKNPDGKAEYNFPRRIWFPDANTLVSVAQSGQVLQCKIDGNLTSVPAAPIPEGKTLFNVNDGQAKRYRVYRAEVSTDGKYLAAASAGPQVVVRNLADNSTNAIAFEENQFPRSIAWQPKSNRLAVAVANVLLAEPGKPRFFADTHDTLRYFEDGGAKAGKSFALNGRAECLAFHPKEPRLAIAGGDGDEVTLFDADTVGKPLSSIRSQGRKPWGLKISQNGNVIAQQIERDPKSMDPNKRGTGEWYRFDMSRLAATKDDKIQWVEPQSELGGWKIVPDTEDRFIWYAERERPGAEPLRMRLMTDRDRDLAPTCFTFLPAKGNEPVRVIVGHYYGASLFQLDPRLAKLNDKKQLELSKSRIYTGHSGEVISLAASADGTWFLTGGADQTLSAYSLKPWASHPNFGASVELKDGKPSIASLDVGSPAWEAGMRKGDSLDLLVVGGEKIVYDRRPGKKEAGTAEDAVAALKNPQAGVEHYFDLGADPKGNRREILTTVRQRPMWKWFSGFENNRISNWNVWMWHGSYYLTTTAHGDRLVGWHVNSPDIGGTPAFRQLQQFEKHFHKPAAIQKLLANRDIAEALAEAQGPNPLPIKFGAMEPAPVDLAIKNSILNENGLELRVNVAARGSNPDLLPERVELWVNDYRFKVWDGLQQKPFAEKMAIPPELFRNGQNQVSVLTFNGAGGRAEDVRVVRNPIDSVRPNLLTLAVGINDYTDHRKISTGARSFGDLRSAVNDAQQLNGNFEKFLGAEKYFPEGTTALRVNANASRSELLKQLALYQKNAKPNDWLIVFFAGHGDLILPGETKGNILPDTKDGRRGAFAGNSGVFFMCGPNYSPLKPTETGLSSEELYEALAKINCRKLVLLDACHSGQASDANMLRRFIPTSQGPMVMAACEQGELSYEDPAFGHGLFTYAILEALGPQFRRASTAGGSLTTDGLFGYVRGRMPQLLTKIEKPNDAQNPISFPQSLPTTVLLKP